MKCHEVREAIPDLIEGLLDFEEELAVRQHVNACDECYSVYRAYEQDEAALTQYVHRAPFTPVARDVMDEIERGRSPWWDAFMTGSYRLASVAGLVLVLLIVGAGAFALREMAMTNGDEPVNEQPAQDSTLGVASDEESDTSEPALVARDDIPQIVNRLDENGLVYDVDEVDETSDYRFEYGRIAFDRHLTLLEYRAESPEELGVEINVEFETETGERDVRGIQLEPDEVREGWLVLPAMPAHTESVSLGSAIPSDAGGTSHTVSVDLSYIGDVARDSSYEDSATNNGIEVCCLEVERGVAVSMIQLSREVTDPNALVSVDQPPAPYPDLTVDGQEVAQLDHSFGFSNVGTDVLPVAVFDLPESGELSVQYEYMTLGERGEDLPQNVEGPWSLAAQLEEQEPEPDPTTPPNVAEDDSSTSDSDEGVADPEPAETPEPTQTPGDGVQGDEPLRVLVYMVRDGEIAAAAREVDYTQDVATAAIEELLDGLNSDEQNFEFDTAIPEGTELLDISLDDGTITVDLSEEFSVSEAGGESLQRRMAQVVHTLTQFETVDGVDILVEGQPVAPRGGASGDIEEEHYTRSDFEDEAPTILVEHPTPGEIVSGQAQLRGTANTFEANLQIEVIGPNGEQIYRDHAMASSGTGTRGEFEVTVPVDVAENGWGTIRMFENSARDGSRTNVVDIPVRFEVSEGSE